MPVYLRRLSYRRLVRPLLAASQLMLLPDAPQINRGENIVPMGSMFPAYCPALAR
jgi:hypothetical protein